MLRLANKEINKSIHVSEMKDGDIGVIVLWTATSLKGLIVQRYGNSLLCVGCDSDYGWSDIFKSDGCENWGPHYRVRLLEKGETLIVE